MTSLDGQTVLVTGAGPGPAFDLESEGAVPKA